MDPSYQLDSDLNNTINKRKSNNDLNLYLFLA